MCPPPGRSGPCLLVSSFPFWVLLCLLSVTSVCALLFPLSSGSVQDQPVSLPMHVNRAAPNPELPKLDPEQEQFSWSCEENALLASLGFLFSRSFLCLNTGCAWVISMVLQGSFSSSRRNLFKRNRLCLFFLSFFLLKLLNQKAGFPK